MEFAMVVPLVFLFFCAAWEFSRMNMVRNTMEIAAYEGARRGMLPGASVADARTRAAQVLDSVGTRSAAITVTPDPITAQTPRVTVSIQVPLDANAWITPVFLRGLRFQRAFTLACENTGSSLGELP